MRQHFLITALSVMLALGLHTPGRAGRSLPAKQKQLISVRILTYSVLAPEPEKEFNPLMTEESAVLGTPEFLERTIAAARAQHIRVTDLSSGTLTTGVAQTLPVIFPNSAPQPLSMITRIDQVGDDELPLYNVAIAIKIQSPPRTAESSPTFPKAPTATLIVRLFDDETAVFRVPPSVTEALQPTTANHSPAAPQSVAISVERVFAAPRTYAAFRNGD